MTLQMTLFRSFWWLTLSDFTTFTIPPSTCQNHFKICLCFILSALLSAIFFSSLVFFPTLLLEASRLRTAGPLSLFPLSNTSQGFLHPVQKVLHVAPYHSVVQTYYVFKNISFIYLFGPFCCGTRDLVSRPRIEPRPPLHWQCRVFTTGPPGKPLTMVSSTKTIALSIGRWCVSNLLQLRRIPQ